MKKNLLGSTAIVGASLLLAAPAVAQGPELSLDGYVKFEVWFDDQDAGGGVFKTGDTSQDYKFEVDDARVTWKARATADNGLTYGLNIQMDIDGNTLADEAYLIFEGGWGSLRVGADDGAEDAMRYHGKSILVGQGGYDGGLSAVFDFGTAPLAGPGLIGGTGDATKVTYFTPRFGGVQIGVSYTPDSGQDVASGRDKVDDFDLSKTQHAITSDESITDELTNSSFDPASTDTEDSVELGVNFVQSFNGVDVTVAGVAIWADAETDLVQANTVPNTPGNDFEVEDVFSWAVGGSIGYAGFSVAGGYGDSGDSLGIENDGSVLTSGVDTDSEFWDVAASYSSGPFAVSVGYFEADTEKWLWAAQPNSGAFDHTENDMFYSQETEVDILSVGAEWTLAPGLLVYAEYNNIDVEIDNGRVDQHDNFGDHTSIPEGGENDGDVFMIGAKVSF